MNPEREPPPALNPYTQGESPRAERRTLTGYFFIGIISGIVIGVVILLLLDHRFWKWVSLF